MTDAQLTPPLDPVAELARRVWITKGARFAAHRRLMRKSNWSTWAMAVLSTYIIAASLLLPGLLRVDVHQVRDAILAAASILVLALSLIEGSHQYALRAARLHECAVRLGALELRVMALQATKAPPTADLQLLQRKYVLVLESCPDNHNRVDFDTFRAQHYATYSLGRLARIGIWLRTEVHTVGPYLGAMLLPPLLLLVLR